MRNIGVVEDDAIDVAHVARRGPRHFPDGVFEDYGITNSPPCLLFSSSLVLSVEALRVAELHRAFVGVGRGPAAGLGFEFAEPGVLLARRFIILGQAVALILQAHNIKALSTRDTERSLRFSATI